MNYLVDGKVLELARDNNNSTFIDLNQNIFSSNCLQYNTTFKIKKNENDEKEQKKLSELVDTVQSLIRLS